MTLTVLVFFTTVTPCLSQKTLQVQDLDQTTLKSENTENGKIALDNTSK